MLFTLITYPYSCCLYFLILLHILIRRSPSSILFPYTTLFRSPPLSLFTSGLVLGFLYFQRESSARTQRTRIVNKVVRSISEASYATLLVLCDKYWDWHSHGY